MKIIGTSLTRLLVEDTLNEFYKATIQCHSQVADTYKTIENGRNSHYKLTIRMSQ